MRIDLTRAETELQQNLNHGRILKSIPYETGKVPDKIRKKANGDDGFENFRWHRKK